MSTTTDILFNSPALNSLKRDQLVKLCKIHSVKASGKNIELIARLKQVAETLPKDAPLSIAARSETENEESEEEEDEKENFIGGLVRGPRMESIVEESSSQGSLSSHRSRDFGTASSKTSVSSSIKAFASSFGLKRSTSAKSNLSTSTSSASLISVPPLPANSKQLIDELSLHAKPYSSISETDPSLMPQTDNFTFTPDPKVLAKFDFNNTTDTAPIPGHILRPGAPAPENARLSLGLGLGQPPSTPNKKAATTTIRLISNSSINNDPTEANATSSLAGPSTPQLKPWNTTFDLVLGSPSNKVSVWPPRDNDGERLYPRLPLDFGVAASKASSAESTDKNKDVDMPDALTLSSSKAEPEPVPSTSNVLSPKSSGPRKSTNTADGNPFVFGSPLPQHRVSNTAFRSAAADILAEMNKRLGADGVAGVDSDILTGLVPGAHKEPLTMTPTKDGREIKPLRSGVKEKFEKAHEEQFRNMEGIDVYLGRKVASGVMAVPKTADNDKEPVRAGKKRKSSVLEEDKKPRRPTAGPVRSAGTRVISNGRRNKLPGAFGDDDDDEEDVEVEEERAGKKAKVEVDEEYIKKAEKEEEEERERLAKEREAIRRKLEIQRARRRSSAAAGRLSTGRGRVSGAGVLQKPPPKPAARSRFGFLSTAAKSIVKGVWGGGGTKKPAPAPSTATSSNTTSNAGGTSSSRKSVTTTTSTKGSMGPPPPPSGTQKSRQSTLNGAGPARPSTSSAAPTSLRVPSNRTKVSMTGTMTSINSTASSANTSRSPIPSFGTATRNSSVRSSVNGVSTTASRNPSLSGASGTSGSRLSSTSNASGTTSSRVSSLGTRTSAGSRLLAPTASSLAKSANPNVATQAKLRGLSSAPTTRPLNSITNDLSSPGGNEAGKTTPGKIFSKPLVVPPGSGIPSPVRTQTASGSMTAASAGVGVIRTKSGRKPRISRSKVIAKLASQRAAASSGGGTSGTSTGTSSGSTLRPSLGANARVPRKSGGVRSAGGRRSHAGDVGRGKEAAVLMSAKKRARQSEYARRRSGKPVGMSAGAAILGREDAMDVDD
ncbi:hypothetical protein D9758_005423 [Tetrapyrgos nigripes]|uniref:SAP domain-containing protein n=1 Tax=Tetrapyrgos nigripes TaxID=182062 RepID=A0A8H5GHM6_9AGAR|nr:hypothetical protein D9758_005423 [Tetrapyrgos nigripes]